MDITTITITYELRQNLGDYSGVKMAATMTAAVEEGEDPEDVRVHLLEMARQQVQTAVDDALEQNGREVIYYGGPLFKVAQSDVRQCIVILPADVQLPQEETWKERDSWYTADHNAPGRMRLDAARLVFHAALDSASTYLPVDCTNGDLSKIPPLPAPGPEPLWHSKNLQRMLEAMGIDPALWDELAGLEHVTAEFLEKVYREIPIYGAGVRAKRLEIIRSGVLPAPEDESDDEDESDEDEFDDEEDGEDDGSF